MDEEQAVFEQLTLSEFLKWSSTALKEPQTISIYWFYLLHNYVVMSTKSK